MTGTLHSRLQEAAVLRTEVFDAHGIDAAHLAHLSREHRRCAQGTAHPSPADMKHFRSVVQQIEAEEPRLRPALAALFRGQPGVVRVTGIKGLSPAQQVAAAEAAAFISAVTAMNITVHLLAQPGRSREAYDPYTCSLLLSATGTPAPVIVHEMGHALEHQAASATLVELRREFFARRTAAELPVPLVTVTGNGAYHPTEHAKTDQWLHPYIGKLYADVRASELVSMGLQLLYADPVLLAGDLEYLDFLHVFLRGSYE